MCVLYLPHTHVGACQSQKNVLDPLDFELHTLVGCCLDARNKLRCSLPFQRASPMFPRDEIQDTRLGGKYLHMVSHLFGPRLSSLLCTVLVLGSTKRKGKNRLFCVVQVQKVKSNTTQNSQKTETAAAAKHLCRSSVHGVPGC